MNEFFLSSSADALLKIDREFIAEQMQQTAITAIISLSLTQNNVINDITNVSRSFSHAASYRATLIALVSVPLHLLFSCIEFNCIFST